MNASHSLLLAYKKRNTENFAVAARDETLKMRDDLRKIIEER